MIQASKVNLSSYVTSSGVISAINNSAGKIDRERVNLDNLTLGFDKITYGTKSDADSVQFYDSGFRFTDMDGGNRNYLDVSSDGIKVGNNQLLEKSMSAESFTTQYGDLWNTGSQETIAQTSISVANQTWTVLGSVTLTPGVWVIHAYAQYGQNANGYRCLALSRSEASSGALGYGAIDRSRAVDGNASNTHVTYIAKYTSNQMIYLLGYQNSGSALTTYYGFQSVRIA